MARYHYSPAFILPNKGTSTISKEAGMFARKYAHEELALHRLGSALRRPKLRWNKLKARLVESMNNRCIEAQSEMPVQPCSLKTHRRLPLNPDSSNPYAEACAPWAVCSLGTHTRGCKHTAQCVLGIMRNYQTAAGWIPFSQSFGQWIVVF